MTHVAEAIRSQISGYAEGASVMAKQFLHLGSRAAVDQALSRLCRGGELLRAGRGVYVRPITTRFGVRSPEPTRVVEALAAARGETIVPSEAASANALGLTTQVPMRRIYLTSGSTRHLKVGAEEIELRHARAPWLLLWPNEIEGQVLRGLAALTPEEAASMIGVLRRRLTPAQRQRLAGVSTRVPGPMAANLTALAHA